MAVSNHRWLLAIISLVFVLGAGCALQETPQPLQIPESKIVTSPGGASTSEPVKTEAVASPTPPEPTLAPNTMYENEQYGLRFEAPPGFQRFDPAAFWNLRDGVLWAAGFSAPDDLEPLEYQSPLGVTVYANPENLPLDKWFEKRSGHPTADPYSQIYFFDPMPGEVADWNGNSSLHYLRAQEPRREELLIARPGIVVGVHFASGLAYDYKPAYEYILGTLVFSSK